MVAEAVVKAEGGISAEGGVAGGVEVTRGLELAEGVVVLVEFGIWGSNGDAWAGSVGRQGRHTRSLGRPVVERWRAV